MTCWISFKFASCGCIACCCKSLLIQVHGVHEKGKNNSFIVPDLLAFLRAHKQCFDLGVQELTNIPRNDWKKEGLLRLVDLNYLNLFTILDLLEVNHVLFWLLR